SRERDQGRWKRRHSQRLHLQQEQESLPWDEPWGEEDAVLWCCGGCRCAVQRRVVLRWCWAVKGRRRQGSSAEAAAAAEAAVAAVDSEGAAVKGQWQWPVLLFWSLSRSLRQQQKRE